MSETLTGRVIASHFEVKISLSENLQIELDRF